MHYSVLLLQCTTFDLCKMKGFMKTQETLLQCEKRKSTVSFDRYLLKAHFCQSLV